MTEQLELFPRTREEVLEEELAQTKKALDSLRKGLFHRHSGMAKNMTAMQDRLEEMQMQILMLDKYIKSMNDES